MKGLLGCPDYEMREKSLVWEPAKMLQVHALVSLEDDAKGPLSSNKTEARRGCAVYMVTSHF